MSNEIVNIEKELSKELAQAIELRKMVENKSKKKDYIGSEESIDDQRALNLADNEVDLLSAKLADLKKKNLSYEGHKDLLRQCCAGFSTMGGPGYAVFSRSIR